MIAVGLAMDAFAVSVTAGISIKKIYLQHALRIALYFGFFQAVMPVAGWFLGFSFIGLVQYVSHWIAFLILILIGTKMIIDSSKDCEVQKKDYTCHITLLVLAITTSIDAFSVGISFSMIRLNVIMPVIIIGIITFMISLAGVYLGKVAGCFLKGYAEIAGGVLLILIGIKIIVLSLIG